MKGLLRFALVAAVLMTGIGSFNARAQFREEAFTQTYNEPNDTTFASDTTDKMFSFREYFDGLGHKQPIRIGTMFAGSLIFIGGEQIYNKQYWKLPIVYGGLGSTLGVGIWKQVQYKKYGNLRDKQIATGCFIGAGVIYWATLLDGVISYDRTKKGLPGRATLYSLLVPGLGQAYNGEFWKVPIYDLLIAGSAHFFVTNNLNYQRYRRIYAETSEPGYSGPISSDQAVYYRDVFRRYRDYSILAMVGFYLLQVIDANVFSYMRDFEISDDISMNVGLGIINPELQYALDGGYSGPESFAPVKSGSGFGASALSASTRTTLFGGNAVGLTLSFKF